MREDTTPATLTEQARTRHPSERIVQAARSNGRTRLTAAETRQLLAAYALPAAESRVVADHVAAIELAGALGYPVTLAPVVEGAFLRGDMGVLRLHAGDQDGVGRAYRSLKAIVHDHIGPQHFQGVRIQPMLSRDAWTVGLRSTIDPQLGPVLHVVAPNPWAATAGDHVIALPLLTIALVRQLLAQAPLGTALQATYGRGVVDLAALEQFLVNFSHLVADQRWIKEICIDPLLASRERVLALDPIVLLHGPDIREEQLPELVLREAPARGTISGTPDLHRAVPFPLGLITGAAGEEERE